MGRTVQGLLSLTKRKKGKGIIAGLCEKQRPYSGKILSIFNDSAST